MVHKKILLIIFVLVVVLVFSTAAEVDTSVQESGITLIVDGNGHTGADYTSIQAAIDAANTGDTIEVRAGTYNEDVIVNKRLNIIGVLRDGSTPVIDACGFDSAITINADGCVIEGLRIIGADHAGITVNSDNSVIKGNIVLDNNIGIKLDSSGNSIFNNYLDNTHNAQDSGSNYWNTSMKEGTNIIGNPYLGGNYWSDYTGEDMNGDGFGDTPHQGDALPLVISAATPVDTYTHGSHPPPEEIPPVPYEVSMDMEVDIQVPDKRIDEPGAVVTAPPSGMSDEEEILVEQLREAKTSGDMEEAVRIEEELAKLRGQSLEYVAPTDFSEGEGPQGGPVSPEDPEANIKWSGYDVLVAGTDSREIRPSIASDEDGNLYIAVEYDDPDSSIIRIYKSTNNGSSWYYWYWLTWGPDLTHPSLTIAEGNKDYLLLALNHDDDDIVVFRVNLSNISERDFNVVSSYTNAMSYPRIVTDSSEHYGWYSYIVYNVKGPDGWNLYFSRSFDYGETWTKPEGLWWYGQSPIYCAYPDIDYGSYTLYVAFDSYPNLEDDSEIYVKTSSDNGGSWNSEVRLTNNADNEFHAAVAAVKNYTTAKTAVIAYTRFWDSDDDDVWYAYTQDGGANWNVNYCLACTAVDNEKSPDLTTSNSQGAIHAAYRHDYDTDYRFADYLTPYWWSGVNRINNENSASSYYSRPSIVANPQKPTTEQAGIAWTDYRNNNYDIYFDAPSLPVGCGCYDHDTSTWIYPPSNSDWNIDHYIECNCTSIKLNGDLNIHNTGRLDFNNVYLEMNCTENGEYGINVYNGGEFNINDLEGFESVITNGDVWNAYYTFRVHDGSSFNLIGSKVEYAGYAWNLDTAGNNYNNAGIWINTDGTVIDNSEIAYNNFVGVIFYESDNHQVTNTWIHNNLWDGIYMKSSGGNYIKDNWISYNGQDGVDMLSSSDNQFLHNYIYHNNDDGVDAQTCPYNDFLEYNQIWSNDDDGIVASGSDNLNITGNYISSNGEGIVLSSCNDCTLAGNDLYNNCWYGIHLSSNSQHNTLDDNVVMYTTKEAASAGIYLSHSTNNDITNNNANSNLRGIQLWNSGNAIVYHNIANDNSGSGISLENSDDSLVEKNLAVNNSAGISFSSTDSTGLFANGVYDNLRGISLSSSTLNMLNENTAQNNDFGVSLMWSSNYNTIVKNSELDLNNNYNMYLFKSSHNLIDTNNIDDSGAIGLYLEESHSNNITKNTAKSSGNYGIDLFNSDNNIIQYNDVTGSTNIGIGLSSSDLTDISYNTAEGSNRGISMRWSSDNQVIDNDANENDIGVYMFQSDRNTVSDNRINDNNNSGLEISVSDENKIIDNEVYHNPNYGIHAYSSKNNNIAVNDVILNSVGIFLDWSEYNNIEKNTVNQNNIVGIALDWSSNNNDVKYNDAVSNNNISIQVSQSSNNLLLENTASGSAVGIFLDWSPDNHIINNDASNNLYHGITLDWFSDGNEIRGNDAYNNIIGISMQRSSENDIRGNNASDSNVSINLEWSSNNNLIQDNLANNNQYYGISLSWSSNGNDILNNTANNSIRGLYFDEYSTGNTVNNNIFCGNLEYDIDDDDSNTGDDNKCDFTDNWNDIGTTDCTCACEQAGLEPDLVITGIWVCWDDNCTICYNITNIGDGTASQGHNTELIVAGVSVASEIVPVQLAPDDSYTGCFHSYKWTYTPPVDNITVCADSVKVIDESNETNNCLTETWICGDVDGNGAVNILDARLLMNHVSHPGYPVDLWAGDVTGNGVIDSGDVQLLLMHVFDSNAHLLECGCAN